MAPASSRRKPDAVLVARAMESLRSFQPAVDPLVVEIRRALKGVEPRDAITQLMTEVGHIELTCPTDLSDVVSHIRTHVITPLPEHEQQVHWERLLGWLTVMMVAWRSTSTPTATNTREHDANASEIDRLD